LARLEEQKGSKNVPYDHNYSNVPHLSRETKSFKHIRLCNQGALWYPPRWHPDNISEHGLPRVL